LAHCNKFYARSWLYSSLMWQGPLLWEGAATAPCYEHGRVMRGAPSETLERMTRTELLGAAAEKLVEAAKLLDRVDEDALANDALELAERVNLRIALN
jgi:hypothetical protein